MCRTEFLKLAQPMRLFVSIFFALLLAACGGDENERERTVVQEPVRELAFVAGQLGGQGNADGLVGRFSHPVGIAVSDTGVIYVKDANGGPIRKIRPDGVVSSILSTAKDALWFKLEGLQAWGNSSSLALDKIGNLYIADINSCQILRVSPDEVMSVYAGQTNCGYADGRKEQALFGHLDAIATDKSGNIYIVDYQNCVIRKIDVMGVVSTIAGQVGIRGITDGDRTKALFSFPTNIAVDNMGNIYVADSSGKSIRKIAVDGTVSTLAPKWENTQQAVTLRNIAGMVTDQAGNLFVFNELKLQKISPDGFVKNIAGKDITFGSSYNDDYGIKIVFQGDGRDEGDDPEGGGSSYTMGKLSIDKQDNLYYADTYGNCIRKIRTDTWVSIIAGRPEIERDRPVDGVGASARFFNPRSERFDHTLDFELRYDLFNDAEGNVYVKGFDWKLSPVDVRKVNKNGEVSTLSFGQAQIPDHTSRDGIKYFVSGNQVMQSKLKRIPDEPEYNLIGSDYIVRLYENPVDGKGTQARFFNITASTIDSAGNLYVIDRDSIRDSFLHPKWNENNPFQNGDRDEGGLIRKISPDGVVTTIAGSIDQRGYVDGAGKIARFHVPFGIAADKMGNLWISDAYNHVIRKISPDGMVSTFAGSAQKPGSKDGVGLNASFNTPKQLIFDLDGNLLVDDSGNFLVRKITPSGRVTTVAGTLGSRGVIPGKLPASISSIHGMTMDAKGTLYIFSERALLKIAL